MTEAEAQRRIEIEAQWTVSPGLTVDEVAYCVERGRSVDENGVSPGDDGYVETWMDASVRWAIGLAWAIKAAKVTPKFHGKAGDVEGERQQVFEMCSKKAREYGYRGGGSGGLGSITLVPSGYGLV